MTETEGLEDTALHEAVRYADVDDVKDAIQNGCDPNQIGLYQWTPLHEAANNGDLSIVKLLLKYKGIQLHFKNTRLEPVKQAVFSKNFYHFYNFSVFLFFLLPFQLMQTRKTG